MNTVRGYVDGPGGAAFMTSITSKVIKWGIEGLGFKKDAGAVYMLLDAVEAWADGSAIGYGVKEIIYPSVSQVGATFGGIGALGSAAIGSKQEMATKDAKPKARVVFA